MIGSRKSWTRAIAAGAAIAVTMAAPVLADCYDIVGCSDRDLFSRNYSYLASVRDGPTCDFLYQMRNRIYAEHGYCFQTARGQAEIGNDGCRTGNMAAIHLSRIEQANVATIQRAERAKYCPS